MRASIICAGDDVATAWRHVKEEFVIDEVLLVEREEILFEVVAHSDRGEGHALRSHIPKLHAQVVTRDDVVGEGRKEFCEREGIYELGEGVLLLTETNFES